MKQDNFIQGAIDESLSGVRFDAKDAHTVLRAVRGSKKKPARRLTQTPRFQPVLAMAMTLLVLVPIGLFALRAQKTGTTRISAAPGYDNILPVATGYPQAVPADDADEVSNAIGIARTCFESVCDTSIFSFHEYTVKTSCLQKDAHSRVYTVSMTSIYDNGCTFSVTVAMPQGEVMHYTTPALATVPTYIDISQLKPASWYTKYGPHLMTWPQDAQAEFSRRYEGGMLREAKTGELTAQEATDLAINTVRLHLPVQKGIALYAYPMLYSERAGADGAARYVVSVFAAEITDTLPEALGTVSFRPDGSDLIADLT